MRFLFFFFIIIPIVEMYLLLKVGALIGAGLTIGLVVLTAIIGSYLLRQQGVATLTNAQTRMNSGQMPATELFEGIFLAVGGALLLTPGFVTDTIGFACLIPFTRKALIQQVIKSGAIKMQSQGGFSSGGFHGGFYQGGEGGNNPFANQAGSPFESGTAKKPDISEDGRGHVIIEGDFDKEGKDKP